MDFVTMLSAQAPLLMKAAFILFLILISLMKHRHGQQVKRLEKQNDELIDGMLFLLSLEEKHCREHKEQHGQTLRNTMRKAVQLENQLEWDSRYSESQLRKLKQNKLKKDPEQGNFLLQMIQNVVIKATKP